MFKKIFLTFIFIVVSIMQLNASEGLTVVAVGEASVETDRLVIHRPYLSSSLSASQRQMANELGDLFRNNFAFYRSKFDVREREHSQSSLPSLNRSQLKDQNVRYVLLFRASPGSSPNSIQVELQAHDTVGDRIFFERTTTISQSDLRKEGHKLANSVYKGITGVDSIFTSRILFVSDRGSQSTRITKELYIMDFDGRNAEPLTNHRGIVISPSISYDGTRVLYSLIEDESRKDQKRNVDLYLLDLRTGKTELLSSRSGINSGAIFMPGDESILLTLSHTGTANIYTMDLNTREITRLTSSHAPDVDPSINRDGSLMSFLSGRSGAAMIYTMDPRSRENNTDNRPRRISFVGTFNATPRFNPDGTEIAFASWMEGRFDIFRINSDGTGLARLTRNFGSNEDPTFSPDGEFLAFSSQRVISREEAEHNIYIMDRDGDIIGRITHNLGNCITPRWSRPPKSQ